jgi:hypothetical protein
MLGLPSRFLGEHPTRDEGNGARDRCAMSPLPKLGQRGRGNSVGRANLRPSNTAPLDQLAGARTAASLPGGANRCSDWHIQDDMASQGLVGLSKSAGPKSERSPK